MYQWDCSQKSEVWVNLTDNRLVAGAVVDMHHRKHAEMMAKCNNGRFPTLRDKAIPLLLGSVGEA